MNWFPKKELRIKLAYEFWQAFSFSVTESSRVQWDVNSDINGLISFLCCPLGILQNVWGRNVWRWKKCKLAFEIVMGFLFILQLQSKCLDEFWHKFWAVFYEAFPNLQPPNCSISRWTDCASIVEKQWHVNKCGDLSRSLNPSASWSTRNPTSTATEALFPPTPIKLGLEMNTM